jgi:predicted acyltransferase
MFFLIAESTGIYEYLMAPPLEGTILRSIGLQFQHHPWAGLRLWDLGQPFFMFISGVAMAFSYGKRWELGEEKSVTLRRALKRSWLLFLIGWALYFVLPVEGNPGGAFLLDMLPQLAFASLLAYLLMRRSWRAQISVSLGLLVLTEFLYRIWPVPGFDQPFTPDLNFGSWLDIQALGKLPVGHWVAFNIIPLAAFTIWGVVAGQMLRGPKAGSRKLRLLVVAGSGSIAAGLALSLVTPVIRRISTSSFVILAGGFCMLALALAFWIVESGLDRKWAAFFAIVGMNPLFIYLFSQSGGAAWLRGLVEPLTMGAFIWAGKWPAEFVTSLAALSLLRGL